MTVSNFKLDLIETEKLKRVNVNGKRHYEVGTRWGLSYLPSVTTVLSMNKEKQKSLHEWRRRVGAEEANRVSRRASSHGTAVHQLIEDYIRGDELSVKNNPFAMDAYRKLQRAADKHIGTVRMIEQFLWSEHLMSAGTPDLAAEFDSRLSIIDWKTSARDKRADMIEDYFVQKSAYAVMFEERTGIPVDQLVTIIASEESQEAQIFVRKRDDWIDKFIEYRAMYARHVDQMK